MLGAPDQPTLDGIGCRRCWPEGPGCSTEDDFWVDPQLGLAIVARGIGAIGGQGKPAGKLAVWSLAGEVGAPAASSGDSAQAGVQRGMDRAQTAVQRLSANWPSGLGKPMATMAALLLAGPTAIVAHIGDCRVTRIRPDSVEILTTEHTLATMFPSEHLAPQIARVLTRALGSDGAPEIQRLAVQLGDVFLLTTADVHDALPGSELAGVLAQMAAPGCDPAAVLDELVRKIEAQKPDGGRATLALVKVGHGRGRQPTRGSSRAPRLPWLFAPGAPLADPPGRWATGTPGHGPDQRWFSEVHGGVMADPER